MYRSGKQAQHPHAAERHERQREEVGRDDRPKGQRAKRQQRDDRKNTDQPSHRADEHCIAHGERKQTRHTVDRAKRGSAANDAANCNRERCRETR